MRRLLVAIALILRFAPPARAACDNVTNVRLPAGGDFTSIQAAVNALPNPIPSNWCINIDSSTYSEQVTIQNFTFTYSSDTLTLQSDPALVSTNAAVNPPALSTAAFQIMNTSVTLSNIAVITTNTVSYGVLASSGYVTMTSVTVDSGGMIDFAGISLSSVSAVSYSSVTVQNAHGLVINGNLDSVSVSTLASGGAGFYGLLINGVSSNTISQSFVSNNVSTAVFFSSGSFNAISQSTITSAGAFAALWLNGSSSATIARSFVFNSGGYGAFIGNNSNFAAINLSTVANNAAGFPGLFIFASSSDTVLSSLIQGSTAVIVSGSTGTVITASVLTATNTFASAVWLTAGSVNLFMTSNTVRGGPQGMGVFLDAGNTGSIRLTSTTVEGARLGLNISTQAVGAALQVSSITFQNLPAGTTAINFLGGAPVSTFTSVYFADVNMGINVNARALSAGSQVTMRTSSGPRTGPGWADDPSSLVYWPDAPTGGLPAGCGSGYTVKKDASQHFTTIQAALNGLQKTLSGNLCVVVGDSQTYGEQVLVHDFINNGFQLKIMADPALSQQPVVSPPAASTAAFQILNASVTVLNFMLRPSGSASYGVQASSANVTLSSVNVDGSATVGIAGFLISSAAAVSYSSVTVASAHGLVVLGQGASISFSTLASSGASAYGLFLNAASGVSVSQSFITNALGTAAFVSNGGSHALTRSTITAAGGSAALWLNASSNVVTQCYIGNPVSTGAFLDIGAINNTLTQTTMTSNSPSPAMLLNRASSNTVTLSLADNPGGYGAFYLNAGANTVSLSTLSAGGTLAALYVQGSSNVFSQTFISNPFSTAAFLDVGAVNDVIILSTVTSNFPGAALVFNNASSDSVRQSVVMNPAGTSARLQTSGSVSLLSSRVDGSTAVAVFGSTGTVITASRLTAQSASGSALWFGQGGVNLTLTSNTLTGGALGAGFFLDTGNNGTISLTSTTVLGAGFGMNIATQTPSAVISISSVVFRSLPAGTTAVNFLGGSFAFSISAANFSDTNIGINVNARALSPGSLVTMTNPKGPRTGPGWADDPSGFVAWPDAPTAGLPAGCDAGYSVKKDASQHFTSIQAAVNGLNKTLTSELCVVVRDSMTYSEQITIQGFTTNGFQLHLLPDPALSQSPLITPPAASTAAFQVLNDSVSISGFNILATSPMPYGVEASSSYLTISTVNVDSGGNIGFAGMAVSSFSSVAYSSITVQSAHALMLTSTGTTVSFSTMASAGQGGYALFLNGASASLVTRSAVSNPISTAAFISGGGFNTLSRSTVTSAGPGAALWIHASANNSISQDFFFNPPGFGVYLGPTAANNTIDRSVILSTSSNAPALFISGASNSVDLDTVQGSTAVCLSGSTSTVITSSVLTATGAAASALWLTRGSVNLTISSNNLTARPLGAGIFLDNGGSGLISLTSTTISGARFGLAVATQAAGANIAVSSMTFQSLPAGATAIAFFGGAPVSTFSAVDFIDATPAVNVDASLLGAAARVTMADAVGPRSGPCFEDDPGAHVDWPGFTICGVTAAAFTGVVSSSLTANWTSTFPGGTFYYAQLSTAAFPNSFSGNATTITVNTSVGFTSLTQNTAYFSQVSPNSVLGPFTALGSTTTPLQLVAPTTPGVSAVGIALINWSWSAVPGALGYKVYSASSPATLLASIAPPAFSYVNLSTNTIYGVTVAAFNAGGQGPLSLSATAFTLAVPPSSTTALSVYPASATLAWALNSNPAGTTGEVQRSTDNANYSSIFTAATTTYTDPFLQDCSTYFYRVRNQNGNSLPTGFDGAISVLTPGQVPMPPVGLTALALGGNQISLSWGLSPSTAVASQYRLYTDSGSGTVSYAVPYIVFSATETGWLTGVFPSTAAVTFVLRTKTACGVEETAGVTARAPSIPTLAARRAAIKAPESGKRIRGNSVSLIAELTSGALEATKNIKFQSRPSGIANWSNIATADLNHPNPAATPPFVLHWDVTGLAIGLYDLRAVAVDVDGVSDPAPDAVTVNVVGPADPTFEIDESVDPVTGALVHRHILNNSVLNTIEASGLNTGDPVAKIQIPAGALTASTVSLTALCNPVITTAVPSGFTPIGSSVKLTLSNGQSLLVASATLTLSYPASAPTDRLLILSLNEGTGRWSQDFDSTVDTTSQTLTGLTPHFSIFAIFASAGGPASNLANVVVYPVPYKPEGSNADEGKPFVTGDATTGITFDNLPAAVSIRIYTLSGRLVAKFETAAGKGKIQWDARNMEGHEAASGGYFAVLSAPDQKSVVKRLLIIR